jgi:hypothetical protein
VASIRVEVFAQTGQGIAHGGLSDVHLVRRARDALFAEQGVEGNEQVQVQSVETHGLV